MVRVKICGCRSPQDAIAAAEAGADFVGIMFAESRRRVEIDDASEIVRSLGTPLRDLEQTSPPALFRVEQPDLRSWFEHGAAALGRLLERKRPLTVGVFAGMEMDQVNEIADEAGIDLIQLSGGEPWGECLLANRQVIKVVHVAGQDPISQVQAGSALAVMLDKARAGAWGGTGEAVDWDLAAGIAAQMPVWLAGGLTPENVAGAIARVRPWCVDVSTGVETDGAKDYAKITAFARAVQAVS